MRLPEQTHLRESAFLKIIGRSAKKQGRIAEAGRAFYQAAQAI